MHVRLKYPESLSLPSWKPGGRLGRPPEGVVHWKLSDGEGHVRLKGRGPPSGIFFASGRIKQNLKESRVGEAAFADISEPWT